MSNSLRSDNLTPVLTSAHGTPSCANFPPKSPRPHPHSLQKGTCNRVLFSALFIWEDSNNIAAVTRARSEDFTNGDTFQPRLCFLQPVYSLISLLKRPENSPISKYFLQGGGLWAADFGWGLAKLGVPRRDVETGGEIV